MRKARIENNTVIEICEGNPSDLFHPDIAVLFNVDIDENVEIGFKPINGIFTKPIENTLEASLPTIEYKKISPLEFKMLFTVTERIAIKNLKLTDEIICDWYEILDDPRLKEVDLGLKSTQDGLNYLVSKDVLEESRVSEILEAKIV